MFTILNSRQKLHFSAAHMTIFQDGSKEALHGHNYQVNYALTQTESTFELFLDFSIPKKLAEISCDILDEKVLIAANNPFQTVKQTEFEVEVKVAEKRYVFPKDEVVILETDNVTTESLSVFIFEKMKAGLHSKLATQKKILATLRDLKITVWESVGQGAAFEGHI